MVRPAKSSWRSKTHLLRVSILFLCILWWTSMMDHHTLDGPSCTTVVTVRDPSSKGLHDGHRWFTNIVTTVCPAYPSYLSETFLQGSPHQHSWSKTWRTPWRFIVLMMNRHLVHRVSLLLQKSHYSLALIFILFCFCSSCLFLQILILTFYVYYLLWHQNKINFTHVGIQSLSPHLLEWL